MGPWAKAPLRGPETQWTGMAGVRKGALDYSSSCVVAIAQLHSTQRQQALVPWLLCVTYYQLSYRGSIVFGDPIR